MEETNNIKGAYNGLCNRTACQAPGAVYYNHSTEKYYCVVCADLINHANRYQSLRMYGHELCIKGEEGNQNEY
jgi:hypothetical protein